MQGYDDWKTGVHEHDPVEKEEDIPEPLNDVCMGCGDEIPPYHFMCGPCYALAYEERLMDEANAMRDSDVRPPLGASYER